MLTLYNAKRRSLKQWAERMEECQRRLTEQRIEPGNPGTILNDRKGREGVFGGALT